MFVTFQMLQRTSTNKFCSFTPEGLNLCPAVKENSRLLLSCRCQMKVTLDQKWIDTYLHQKASNLQSKERPAPFFHHFTSSPSGILFVLPFCPIPEQFLRTSRRWTLKNLSPLKRRTQTRLTVFCLHEGAELKINGP